MVCYAIAAASVVAKVTRDRQMRAMEDRYPGYGFARHKGYGTLAHMEAIRKLGISPIHRRSFLKGTLGL
jgi:ribonuclease HII